MKYFEYNADSKTCATSVWLNQTEEKDTFFSEKTVLL